MVRVKRLLLFCEYATLNGGERSLLSVLPAILDHPFEVFVVLPTHGDLVDALRPLDVGLIPMHFYDQMGVRLEQASLRHEFGLICEKLRPDLVHANSLSTSRLSGPVLRDYGCPSVGHLRDIVRLSNRALADLAYHTRLAAVSEATKKWYVEAGVCESDIAVLYNGVDLQRFHPTKPTGFLHAQLGLSPTVPLLGAIGQIGMRKGLDFLFDAMRRVMSTHQQCHLVVVGERFSGKAEAVEFERELFRLASETPLSGRVHFLGYRNDIPDLLVEFCVLVHAARQEPLGRVLLEAAATGVAIVATDVGGTSEIFPPEVEAAILVRSEDRISLEAAVTDLLDDGVGRARLGMAARQRVAKFFNATRAAQGLIELYAEVLRIAAHSV